MFIKDILKHILLNHVYIISEFLISLSRHHCGRGCALMASFALRLIIVAPELSIVSETLQRSIDSIERAMMELALLRDIRNAILRCHQALSQCDNTMR